MAIWAYVCRSCAGGSPASWYVAAARVAEMPAGVRIVRVKVAGDWHCAMVERSRPVEVEQMLVREVIASDEADCPDCGEQLRRAAAGEPAERAGVAARPAASKPSPARRGVSSRSVQAAAISLQGTRLVVVLVAMDLLRSSGEADMAIATLAPSFGGAPIVLLAQDDDGSAHYHGDARLVRLLSGIALERMPWKHYPAG
ncbi:MAG: hypothetical protein IT531_13735 [Burkholderiales bacterium]|nr:hypothetical protein [Burkholderiales bacterium]